MGKETKRKLIIYISLTLLVNIIALVLLDFKTYIVIFILLWVNTYGLKMLISNCLKELKKDAWNG